MFDGGLVQEGNRVSYPSKRCSCSHNHLRCCADGWKLTFAGGRFKTPAKSRYSTIEGECLAVGKKGPDISLKDAQIS